MNGMMDGMTDETDAYEMVVHDWNFLRAEPQIIGISIQLVRHQEKTDKILLLLRMIVNIAQILELIEFKWPHQII